MYSVEVARNGRREIVIVKNDGLSVGGASLHFVQWMQKRVPGSMLSAEQAALVKWYEENRLRDVRGRIELAATAS